MRGAADSCADDRSRESCLSMSALPIIAGAPVMHDPIFIVD